MSRYSSERDTLRQTAQIKSFCTQSTLAKSRVFLKNIFQLYLYLTEAEEFNDGNLGFPVLVNEIRGIGIREVRQAYHAAVNTEYREALTSLDRNFASTVCT